MSRKFIFFINPISGTKNKTSLKTLIERIMARENSPYQFLATVQDGNYQFLPSLINEQKITDIIICGGDGTVNQVCASLLKSNVQVGIIPMGSGNGLAFSAGIPKDPVKAMAIVLNGSSNYIDAFFINNHFSCMLCGLGFDAQVAHDFAKQKSRGLVTYTKQTIKNFFSAKPYPFTIHLNGATINTKAFFISIANSNQFGNNVTIAPKASLHDGLLDIVIVNKMNKLKMIYSLLKHVSFGGLQDVLADGFNNNGIQYIQAKQISIQNTGMAPLHIDGEPTKTSHKFEINIIEKAFKLIQLK